MAARSLDRGSAARGFLAAAAGAQRIGCGKWPYRDWRTIRDRAGDRGLGRRCTGGHRERDGGARWPAGNRVYDSVAAERGAWWIDWIDGAGRRTGAGAAGRERRRGRGFGGEHGLGFASRGGAGERRPRK